MRQRVLITARSIAAGWAALLLIAWLVERPLLSLAGLWIGEDWLATLRPLLDCATLSATGWMVGRVSRWRSNQPPRIFQILVFAVSLLFFNFGQLLTLNGLWLLRVALDTLGNLRYLEGLVTSVATQAILLGSLIVGWMWSRPTELRPLSLAAGEKQER
ncbi:MAG TPA: hypothetical protein VMB25_17755 [Bryobacteraceae bacterium]|nr:hypothetical protein [Bryobacteraceae bacterium]